MAATEMKKQMKRRVLFTGMFIVSMLVIMISVSFSWFNNAKTAHVKGVTVEVIEANNLRISQDDGSWGRSLVMTFPDNFKMKGVAGNGESFFTPVMGRVEGLSDATAVGYHAIEGDLAAKGIYELEFSCLVENRMLLCLDPSSYLMPADDSPQSDYGEYSAGFICAAMRVAFLQKMEDTYRLCAIWIPHATTELIKTGTTALTQEGEVEEQYTFISNEDGTVGATVSTKGRPSGMTVIDEVTYAWGNLNDLDELLEIGMLENGMGDFKIVIWIDGSDRECHNALLNGLVSVKLALTGVRAPETEAPETEAPETGTDQPAEQRP